MGNVVIGFRFGVKILGYIRILDSNIIVYISQGIESVDLGIMFVLQFFLISINFGVLVFGMFVYSIVFKLSNMFFLFVLKNLR